MRQNGLITNNIRSFNRPHGGLLQTKKGPMGYITCAVNSATRLCCIFRLISSSR